MKTKIFQTIITLFILCPNALATNWKTIPEKSKIEFKATQNSSIINGLFKKFDAQIDFNPTQLSDSKVKIEIDVASLQTSLNDATSTLKTSEWFSVVNFPKAIFTSSKFSKINDKKFIVDGKLTIRDRTVPLKFEFNFEKKNGVAIVNSSFAIKRSDFNVGPKDPANAHGVKDDVIISFVIEAMQN